MTSSDTTPSASTKQTAVWPTLRYRDAPAAIEFLADAFGFVAVVVYTSESDPTVVEHAQMSWPLGGGIMLGSERDSSDWPATAGHGATYVVTDRVDELFARALAAGATVVRELTDEDYGGRDFAVRDREGNLWSFGTYAGEPVHSDLAT